MEFPKPWAGGDMNTYGNSELTMCCDECKCAHARKFRGMVGFARCAGRHAAEIPQHAVCVVAPRPAPLGNSIARSASRAMPGSILWKFHGALFSWCVFGRRRYGNSAACPALHEMPTRMLRKFRSTSAVLLRLGRRLSEFPWPRCLSELPRPRCLSEFPGPLCLPQFPRPWCLSEFPRPRNPLIPRQSRILGISEVRCCTFPHVSARRNFRGHGRAVAQTPCGNSELSMCSGHGASRNFRGHCASWDSHGHGASWNFRGHEMP